jgi:hypothetical protein
VQHCILAIVRLPNITQENATIGLGQKRRFVIHGSSFLGRGLPKEQKKKKVLRKGHPGEYFCPAGLHLQYWRQVQVLVRQLVNLTTETNVSGKVVATLFLCVTTALLQQRRQQEIPFWSVRRSVPFAYCSINRALHVLNKDIGYDF